MGYRDRREVCAKLTTALDKDAFRFEDPFGPSADPARYVPREATERALDALITRVVAERRCALLAGVPGIGKTLVLRILRRRLPPELRVVHLRYAALPPAPLCAWALAELGLAGGADPVASLVALARDPQGKHDGLVLLVDDAELLPEETARVLLDACQQTDWALRFVAAGDRDALAGLAQLLAADAPVLLTEPMSEAQTRDYVAAHLEAAGLGEAAAGVFTDSALTELHGRTGGVPARVNAEASRMLRQSFASGAASPARVEEAPAPAAPPPSPPPARPAQAGRPAASERDPALERAVGHLALAHQAEPPPGPPDPSFERAMGRLILAEAEQGQAPVERVPQRPSALLVAAALFALCFIVGGIAGVLAVGERAGLGVAATRPAPAPSAAPAAPVEEAPPPAPVAVQINATPWAEIWIDGESVGVTPLAGVRLTPGAHRFEARFPDGSREERTVEIGAVERYVVFPDAAAPQR